jgi:hypothetical protein
MAASPCLSTKKALLSAVSSGTNVRTFGSICVLTLPLRTLDGRFVEVFVEPKIGDMFLVHEAGRTAGALHAQGIHWTDARRELLAAVADRLGAKLTGRGVFEIACKEPDLAHAILTLSQCATVGMAQIAQHAPVVEDEVVSSRVRRVLSRWNPPFYEIASNVKVNGANGAEHVFDSVAHNLDSKHRTVAVKTLPFSFGPKVQSARYGFLALDIKGTAFDKWRRLAVVAQVDRWPMQHLALVRRLSTATLELRTGEEKFGDQLLVERVLAASKGRRVA